MIEKNTNFVILGIPVLASILTFLFGFFLGLSQPKHLNLEEFAKIKYSIDQFCISQGYLRGGYLVFNDSEILVRCINISYIQRADFKIDNIKLG